jgi:hypothetical protein
MKGNDWLLIAVVVVGLYFLHKREQSSTVVATITPTNPGNGAPPPPGTATASGATQVNGSQSSGLASKVTGALDTFENFSESAGVKAAGLVGIPASVARPLAKYGNPVALGKDVVTGGKYAVKGVTAAAKGVASGAKAAGSAVESGVKKVLGWL